MSRSSDIIARHQAYVVSTYRPSVALVRGEGTRVWDADGRAYLDFLSGIAVLNVGHSHPRVVRAIRDQAGLLTHVSNLYYNELQPRLAEALVARSGLNGKAFFCNSGAEANEALIKLARLWGSPRKRYGVVSMENSFHGRTLATLTATGQAKIKQGFDPLPEGFRTARFNDLESCRAAIDQHTAAFLVEAIQGEGGVVPADPAFLRGLRKLCDEHELLLFCDEVQCGMGRTGYWFGFQAYELRPDAFSVAKALAAGIPMGAMVVNERLAEVFQPGHHATTFGGSPLACAAALAVIEVIESEGLLDQARRMGSLFRERLDALAGRYPFVRGSRGLGLMTALLLDRPSQDFAARLNQAGLLCIATGETAVRFLPPLTITEAEINEALRLIEKVCAAEPPKEAPAA